MKLIRFYIVVLFIFILSLSFVSTTYAGGDFTLVKDGSTYYLSTKPTNTTSNTVVLATDSASTQSATLSASLDHPPRGYAESVTSLISFALKIAMVIALLLVLFNLVVAGIEWITSGGDRGKTDHARQRIIAAVVGIIILAAAYSLVQLVAYVLGFGSFEDALHQLPIIGR